MAHGNAMQDALVQLASQVLVALLVLLGVASPIPPTPSSVDASSLYSVVRVVDGDTIKVDVDGVEETVRLIGMNTPETVDPRRPVECFGKEASLKAQELLDGQLVRLQTEASQGERDKYHRLLAYVTREDGLFFNKHMIEQGYAYEYTYRLPYQYQSEFMAAQKEAEAAGRGLWAPGVCEK